ncbi:OLC1v1004109C1 [Oldenlandia corymbosa var. corymbosa]|uniref:OLC1v1004109C1 n=1 Tax=Oldenlandia corymbosa var. corymbosa TaxID=529605 RepID=A0AAV1DBH3_OLDCO|nr:OLC1v1004109C1 [Oldenlandia corymbosa var. corymbosa]
MAEKDDTEGRCPACRAPYNKEKIVGTAASCERLVAEMNMEKKFKTQKGKTRTSEGRKQLTSVRVIQRNLVYIVGLPLNLADEDLLQRKEYFAQYGKVQKVSISRTAAGTIQQFTNNTCSVYITYSKEEEAVRCIQAVHGFMLEGRPLRACFGTTKYCHAWIRNVPCTNPDCLYLHEVGSQEDSFSKDEIISAYTRNRVQQITSVSNSIQRRSGNVLPPPADDYSSNSSASSGKPISKSVPNASSCTKTSPPNSSSGRSVALPAGASWGTRSFNNQPPSPSITSCNGPQNQKPDTPNGPVSFSTVLASSNQSPQMHSDAGKKLVATEGNNMAEVESKPILEPVNQTSSPDSPSGLSDTSGKLSHHTSPAISTKLNAQSASRDKDKSGILPPKVSSSDDSSSESSGSGSIKDANDDWDETVQSLSSDMLSMNVDKHQSLEQRCQDQPGEPLTSQAVKSVESKSEIFTSNSKPDSGWGVETPEVQVAASYEEKDDLQSFENQRLKDPELLSHGGYFSNNSNPLYLSHDYRVHSSLVNGPLEVKGDRLFVDNKVDPVLQLSGTPFLSSGYPEKQQLNSFSSFSRNGENSYLSSNNETSNHIVRLHKELSGAGQKPASDVGESSIISNILSLDYDTWGESLTSPQNLAKFLGETDKHQSSQRVSSPWRMQQSNQSRFSFAREEEPFAHGHEAESSLGFTDQGFKQTNYGLDFANKGGIHGDQFGRNGFSFLNTEEHDMYTSSHSLYNSNKLTGVRSQIAAPPGFATPNRAPPGFVSHERVEQTFNSFSGHHMLDSSSFRNQYQPTQTANSFSNGDLEFMDPAILAVGKGRLPEGHNSSGLDMRSSFSPQVNSFENDARIQWLMQRSLSSHQNQRFNDMGDAFSSLADSIRNPSRVVDQSLSNGMPPFSQISTPQSRNPLMSNGHWDGWNEVQSGNNLGVTELLRPERFSYNKYFTGYDDSKLRMPGQSDIYNRTFGL